MPKPGVPASPFGSGRRSSSSAPTNSSLDSLATNQTHPANCTTPQLLQVVETSITKFG